ncbi:putative dehydrogenase [Actinoalloteichus hoggarensis]|uniref:1,5-anhydro-D-fructose reductase n=1 Tax=Actinoalloteichus hoggarensis TaxID=1470176 RepID=A0A221W537_9PSEU|nr:Gfo/Idh/MocA family oxidoreductase [Actinoalloteichus hoggarensis]ASO20657.1 1,5-anhydro-D-fructose reductase [Actinoalloteichus hoggarensis]MBB5924490.1 putative dehydrogenase [Actinoalloteichus hoggarensis]
MSGRLGIGVLGCSAIAWKRTLPAFEAEPGIEIVAVASRDPAKARTFADRFDCAATDYAGLLAHPEVEAVYLPLPPSLHLSWGAEVLRSGRHLLTEKPMATTAAEARELIALGAELGLVVRENSMFVHHAQHARVREVVAEGRLGTPRSLRAAFCIPPLPSTDIRYAPDLGGGALLDTGVYPIRAAQLLLGDELTVVGAVLRCSSVTGVDIGGQALLVSSSGVTASLEFGFEHAYGSFYSIWGSAARLHLDRAFTPPPAWQPRLRIEGQDRTEERLLAADHQFANSVRSFAAAASAGRSAAHPEEQPWCVASIRNMELVDRIRATAARVPVQDETGQ